MQEMILCKLGEVVLKGLDGHGHGLAVHGAAGADGNHFCHRGLLLCGAGEDNAALGGLLRLRHLQDNAVKQRGQFHGLFLLIDIKEITISALALIASEC